MAGFFCPVRRIQTAGGYNCLRAYNRRRLLGSQQYKVRRCRDHEVYQCGEPTGEVQADTRIGSREYNNGNDHAPVRSFRGCLRNE